MPILSVKNLNVYYGVIHAIKNVSFEVEKGDIVTLIGANGAGKTTILHTISGLVPMRSGSIEFEDKNINKILGYKLVEHGIAQVPEGRRVFAHHKDGSIYELIFKKLTDEEIKERSIWL